MVRTFTLRAHRPAEQIDFVGDLNDQQRAVATAAGGPMLVIAGAGSGKTRALTYRLAWLLGQGVEARRILLVTFTNRAAREMLARVELLAGDFARDVLGGTFHHVANILLREHGSRLGLSSDFTILDREDSGDLAAACVVEANVAIGERRFPSKAILVSIASAVANSLEPLESVLAKRFPLFAGRAAEIRAVLDLYALRKRERSFLDYDDLLVEWLRLLEEHDDVRSLLAERFEHVLVDEYQDTNVIQGRIVDLLASHHRNLCVVGDDAQAIYGFRGAHFANLLRFRERWEGASEYRLEINYRSTPEILALANASIACNRERLRKTLRAVRPTGVRPAVVPCPDHFVQARFIAEYLLHLLDEGRDLFDLAVLYRSHWHAMEIQLELERRGVPFRVRGGLRFFEQAHVKDVLAFLRVRHNPLDELAWDRILRLVPRVGGALASRVRSHISSATDPIGALASPDTIALLPPQARAPVERFAAVVERLAAATAPADAIDVVMDGFYDDHLGSRYENADLRRQDIRGVAEFAGQYDTVERFLSDVALEGDFDGETCVDGPDEQHFVTLSTVHQAKGLEWPVVMIPWVSDGRFPTDLAMGSAQELEEERRVFHVALTRAKDELYLVVPQVWSMRGGTRTLMKPSRFLTELGDESGLVETMRLET